MAKPRQPDHSDDLVGDRLDKRPYIALSDEYWRNRNIRGLSDKAFRLHITLLCIANSERTDGQIQPTDLDMHGPTAGKQLIRQGLVIKRKDGTLWLKDYLEHQRSAAEIKALSDARSRSGSKGGLVGSHKKWHLARGIYQPNCDLCVAEGEENITKN